MCTYYLKIAKETEKEVCARRQWGGVDDDHISLFGE
jgi:hypothetical protein